MSGMRIPECTSTRPPIILQHNTAPCFRGPAEVDASLMCGFNCGQVLIEHYQPESFAMIGIQCSRCAKITWTPPLPPGEVLPSATMSVGSCGKFRVESTVDVPSAVFVSCEQQITRTKALTMPRNEVIPLVFSQAGLAYLVERYDSLSGGKFAVQRDTVIRSKGSGSRTMPFAWAILHIERCLAIGPLDFRRPDTLTAVVWLRTFCAIVGLWEHHPHFAAVAKQLGQPDGFIHTCFGLIAAAYLCNAGNQIGLSLEDKHGEANPDLYMRTGPDTNSFLEVKAPLAFQWNASDLPTSHAIDRAVTRSIQDSSGQINRRHKGILIVASSYISDAVPNILESAIEQGLARRGRLHRSLAAVVGISPVVNVHTDFTGVRCCVSFVFTVTLNSHYDGVNPVVRGREAPRGA